MPVARRAGQAPAAVARECGRASPPPEIGQRAEKQEGEEYGHRESPYSTVGAAPRLVLRSGSGAQERAALLVSSRFAQAWMRTGSPPNARDFRVS